MTSDAQAALAAAALVMVAMIESSNYGDDKTPYQIEQHTCQMATGLLRWFQNPVRVGIRPADADADERLTPNVDFHSPSQASTERVDPSDVMAAATRARDIAYRSRVGLPYRGPHTLDQVNHTPSGKYACLCGEAWPCSQRDDTQPLGVVQP